MGFSGVSWAADFVHLHVASAYSLRYGVASPAALVARAAQHGMRALALTDRDGLYGAIKHAVACQAAGVAPILGVDLALAGEHMPVRPPRLGSENAVRVTLLASGGRGWASLCRLVSAAHHAGERGAPAVTHDLVAEHTEGLTILLGPASDVGRAVSARRPDLAMTALGRWRERGDAVVEITDHRGPGSTHRAARMLRLAREAGRPAVLSNAVRYRDRADGPVAQVLDAARQLAPLGPRHQSRENSQAYLASGADMARVAWVPRIGSATTPNETARTPAAIAKGIPARIPALSESLRMVAHHIS